MIQCHEHCERTSSLPKSLINIALKSFVIAHADCQFKNLKSQSVEKLLNESGGVQSKRAATTNDDNKAKAKAVLAPSMGDSLLVYVSLRAACDDLLFS